MSMGNNTMSLKKMQYIWAIILDPGIKYINLVILILKN